MPTISIFIRKDDLEKWRALDNKSQWLHDQLDDEPKPYGVETQKEINQVVQALTDLPETVQKVFGLCAHGADPAFCKFAKIKNGAKVCR